MTREVSVLFKDRLDRAFTLEAIEGQSVAAFLFSNHIPLDAVIVRRNGQPVSEMEVRFSSGDSFEIEMVRAYHLPDFLNELRLWSDSEVDYPTFEPPVPYTKRVLWFDERGDARLRLDRLSDLELARHVEDYFVEGILSKDLVSANEQIGLALSGGRDSLSLLYLLSNTQDRLPPFELSVVTIEAISKPHDVQIAREACQRFQLRHDAVSADMLASMFRLRKGIEVALETIYQRFGIGMTINALHAFMRTGIERYFSKREISTVAFGLHTEDLLASLFRSIVDGYPFGDSFYSKRWGRFRFIYPLWPITKKELTLYLHTVAPQKHTTQGSPTPYDRGGWNRDIQYFLADTSQSLWPGFSVHAFEGYRRLMARSQVAIEHLICTNCGGTYLKDDSLGGIELTEPRCGLCRMLAETDQLEKAPSVL